MPNVYRIFIDSFFSEYKKMNRYLRSDATRLSEKDIQDIIDAKNSMKRASEVMASKYKISSRRVYQIWRGVHPPIDPKEMVSGPDSEKMVSTRFNASSNADSPPIEKTVSSESPSSTVASGNQAKKTGEKKCNEPRSKSVRISEASDAIPVRSIQSKPTRTCAEEPEGIHIEELRAFYEKGGMVDEKNKAEMKRLLATT
jgi:hypothetical protein